MKSLFVLITILTSAPAFAASINCDDFGISRIDNLDVAAQTADVTEKTCLANDPTCRHATRLRAVLVRNDVYSPVYQAVDGSRIELYRDGVLAWSLRLCDLVSYPARQPDFDQVKGAYAQGSADPSSDVITRGTCSAIDIDALNASLGVQCVKAIHVGLDK